MTIVPLTCDLKCSAYLRIFFFFNAILKITITKINVERGVYIDKFS